MPILKSAIKSNRQNAKHKIRNNYHKKKMVTLIKNFLKTVKEDPKKAEKFLSPVYSSIDMALKKNLIHKNNAARKKRLVSKTLHVALSSK